MQNYLEPQHDGLPMRPSGPWAIEKLDYLQRYIDVFVSSMHGKPWREMHYIDLFAGPGKCYVSHTNKAYLGSPLIAVKAEHPFTHYFFVDLEPESIAVLQQRCSVSAVCDHVQAVVGDSNHMVREIVTHILAVDQKYISGKWSSLNLAFLDPEGLELEWETVAALAQLNRMDLIIHYPQMGLERYMPQALRANEDTKVDLFFGERTWRDIYAMGVNRPGLHGQLIDFYKAKLQKLGYQQALRDDETGDEPLMRNAKRKAPLYRLLFASKHPLGQDFWHKVTRRNVYGQARLL